MLRPIVIINLPCCDHAYHVIYHFFMQCLYHFYTMFYSMFDPWHPQVAAPSVEELGSSVLVSFSGSNAPQLVLVSN